MSVEQRIIVAPTDRERTAVVTIALPAGTELEIDRTWRFIGWLDSTEERERLVTLQVQVPNRLTLEGE